MSNYIANSSVSLINLDVDTAAQDLKNFFSSQAIFKDYNFNGSALSTLIQLLATNQFKHNFYLNMVFSEMWIASAQLRASLMSDCKDLNYLPRNYTSAQAIVELIINTGGQLNVLVIPKGTTFSTLVGSKSFIFTTDQTIISSSANGYFDIPNISIYEGTYFTDTFLMDYSNANQAFTLSNQNIDLSSISVVVTENSGQNVLEYTQYTTLLDVAASTQAFFIQPGLDTLYELTFGDGIVGRLPADNSIIQATYRVSQGSIANGASGFTLSRDVTVGNNNVSYLVSSNVITTQIAQGGADPETNESIRFNAPRHYETQERAVGETDYEILLKQNFPEIQAVAAFGGETLNPPQYGRVVVSVVLQGVDGLPASRQAAYLQFLNSGRCVKGILPIFTTPIDVYLDITTTVKYNSSQTTFKPNDIESLVIAALSQYNTTELEDFKVTAYYSQISDVIDEAHSSIIANDLDLLVYLKIPVQLGIYYNYNMLFNMALDQTKPPIPSTFSSNVVTTISSSSFIYNSISVQIVDDSQGNLNLVTQSNSYFKVLKQIGTVNYSTGAISIPNFQIQGFSGDAIRLYAQPAISDIVVTGNYIVSIEAEGMNVNAVPILG